ncbi:MAG TPA: O-antigen ligase family protein [Chitinophagales bacterium]|nr:O-antigen ligase family protein [Chitinophagales bacterium]
MTSRIEQWLKWIHQYSLLLIAFFLSAHTRFTGVFVIIALISWLIVNRFRFSFSDRTRLATFLGFTALYLCYSLGMLYTSDQSFGWQLMQLRSSMVLLPLMFLCDSGIEIPPLRQILKWFVAGGITLSLIILGHAAFILIAQHQNIFTFGNLTDFLKINRVYISLYFVMMILALANKMLQDELKRSDRIYHGILILVFVMMVILLSEREEVIALVTATVAMFMMHFISRKKTLTGIAWAAMMSCFLISVIMLFPDTQQRFLDVKKEWNQAYSDQHPTSVTIRKAVWEISGGLISKYPLSGVGTGDVEDSLLHHYQLEKLVWPYNDRLNAHNQFLQTTVALGVFGSLALLLLFITGFRIAIISRNELYFLFLLIFIISNLTESMFETEAGVVFFSFFNSVMAAECLKRKEGRCAEN